MNKREFRQLICSYLLGDGCLTNIGGNPQFTLHHSIKQKDYLLWKVSLIDKIFEEKKLNKRCKIYNQSFFNKKTNKTYYSVRAIFCWAKYFRLLYHKIYDINRVKKIGFLLSNINTDKHVAIWFMDDGHEYKPKGKHKDGTSYIKNPYLYLHICSFSLGEAEIIKQWFRSNYRVDPKITLTMNNQPRLRFTVPDSKLLFAKIAVYIKQIPSMREKFKISLERYC